MMGASEAQGGEVGWVGMLSAARRMKAAIRANVCSISPRGRFGQWVDAAGIDALADQDGDPAMLAEQFVARAEQAPFSRKRSILAARLSGMPALRTVVPEGGIVAPLGRMVVEDDEVADLLDLEPAARRLYSSARIGSKRRSGSIASSRDTPAWTRWMLVDSSGSR